MSAQYHTTLPVDLARPPHEQPLPHQLALNDVDPFVLTALVYDSSAETPADVYPGTVTGQVLRPDGATHDLIGTKGAELVDVTDERGRTWKATACSVTVTAGCLKIPGRVVLSIQLTDSTSPSTTVVMVTFTVNRTNSDVYVVDDAVININTLLNEVTEAAGTATDAAADALDALAQVSNVVSYVAQTPTVAQQRTARDNIGATDETIFEAITGNTPLIGNDGSASNRNCTFSRVGQRYTVSRTAAHSSNSDFSLMPNMHGANYSSAGNNFATWCAESTMALKPGARYRLELKLVSGTPVSGSTGFSIRAYNESATQLTSNTLTVTTRRAMEFTFTGTYFAVMCFVSSGFYTGTDNALVFDLVLTELDSEEEVTGTDPTIMARPDCAYICGTVNTLSFTPCATGLCSVRFTSGTTPTVLTLPNTVVMPDWWTGVEASRTYEISFEDGYGAVTSWAT